MGSSHPLESIAFGLVNIAVIALPIVPFALKTRSSWLLAAAPLTLMLLCGIELYVKTSGPYIEATGGGALGDYIARIGNAAAMRAGNRDLEAHLGGPRRLPVAAGERLSRLRACAGSASTPNLLASCKPGRSLRAQPSVRCQRGGIFVRRVRSAVGHA